MKTLLRSHYASLAGVIWLAALIGWIGAALAVHEAAQTWRLAQDSQAALDLPMPLKSETAVNTAAYQQLARQLGSLHPDVRWVAQSDGIRVEVPDIKDYSVFRLALADVLSSLPGARWQATHLCAGAECQGPAYSALLSATQPSLLAKGGHM